MALPISEKIARTSELITKQPNLVLCIDGYPKCYGSGLIFSYVRVGDPDLYIGNDWRIGGYLEKPNTAALISFDGSTTSIRQQIEADKGRGGSISSIEISLVDFNQEITQLITPGAVVDDVLGRKAKVFMCLENEQSSFPEDYVLLFRGIIDDIKAEPASIVFNIAHPDQKKRQLIFPSFDTELPLAINNSQTTIDLVDSSGLLLPVAGPDAVVDHSFSAFVRIDDELVKYTGVSGNQLTGCVRGQFGTTANPHDAEAVVTSFYRLEGNAYDLALKVMLSGVQGYYLEDQAPSSFQILPDLSTISNGILFSFTDVYDAFGLTVGDYCTVTGASNPSNNFILREIVGITKTDFGDVLLVGGASLADEPNTSALISFRSKYDSLPSGLQMGADEVDVLQHETVRDRYIPNFSMDFYLKDTISNAKDWLENEIYAPTGSYSLPRRTKASCNIMIGPIPGENIKIIDETNIVKPSKIKVRRTITKNFANTIVYKMDQDAVENKFTFGVLTQNASSLSRIKVGSKALVVESAGMREALNGQLLAELASNRKLDRYKYGAEQFNIEVTFGVGFAIEPGDIVILNTENLSVVNTSSGDRSGKAKFFEVQNKSLSIKTGQVQLELVDTNFDGQGRYGLIAPASVVASGASQTELTIAPSFYTARFGVNEYLKWEKYKNCAVKVMSVDGVTRFGQSVVDKWVGNTVTLVSPLGFTPQAGDLFTLADYDVADVTEEIKLIYVHMAPLFDASEYNMI